MSAILFAMALRALALAALLPCAAAQPYTNIIAAQQAADQDLPSFFDGLSLYHIPTSAVPASPAIPADSPARDLVFDKPLAFVLAGVNPTSSFTLTLRFLDDFGGRVQGLAIGPQVIDPSFALLQGAIDTRVFNVTPAAVTTLPTGQHALAISLASLAGPNAILSSFVLASSNPADAPLRPLEPALPTQDLPRLSPRPVSVPAAGSDPLTLPLMGTWDFCPSPGNSSAGSCSNWTTIEVPGEYTLQGFRIPAGSPVLYSTTFSAPAGWAGLRTKLRCDGVSSNATVFLNGQPVGSHLGGFTPFELDLTAALRTGDAVNVLTLEVTGFSSADDLASASKYASHDLGGITRKIYLMALPPVSLAGVHAVTAFPAAYAALALVSVNVSLANDAQGASSSSAVVSAVLTLAGVQVGTSCQLTFAGGQAGGGSVAYQNCTLQVPTPALWDPEHPVLHTLTLTLTQGGGVTEVAETRLGLRDVKVVGNQILVNGRPIKARGTTRHDTHPLVGRSLWSLAPAGGQWARDIAMFRDANVNYIRTSHYPPAEELMEAADELGMFIELEMPFCWASGNVGGAALNYTVQAQREAMVFNRNHPSVILWSLGNESPWTSNFATSLSHYLRDIDSTRPFMFDGGQSQPIPPLDVLSVHYPSFDGPSTYANATQPTLFGEYAHLNCYNRRELATDPGVRDIWGLGIEVMWELIYASQGVLGACYWAGIDDYFYMPSGKPVGYGEWGVVDAWRRAKPETFLVRNIYSPIKIQAPEGAWAPSLTVANRHDFTDLSEVAFAWEVSGSSGNASAAGAPHTTGHALTLHGLPSSPTGTLVITATSPRGFLINTWSFPLAPPTAAPSSSSAGAAPSVQELPDGRLLIQGSAPAAAGGPFAWYVSPTGSVSANSSAGGRLLSSGPTLMVLAKNGEGGTQLAEDTPPILPFTDPLQGWALGNRTWATAAGAVVVNLTGSYPGSAAGAFSLAFDGLGGMQVSYSFTWLGGSVQPRQIGLVFELPAELALLSWRRSAPWPSAYPPDHIGRPAADFVPANVGPAPGSGPRDPSWSADASPIGGADFRATRHNCSVFELASTAAPRGSAAALTLVSATGTVHARAWVPVNGSSVQLLAADLSNEGANPFSRERVLPNPTVSKGTVLQGGAVLQLGSTLGPRG